MSCDSDIKQVPRTDFSHLRNIVKIRNILSQTDAEKLVHAFVTSRLDYCNSLLSGCPSMSLESPRLVQNAAARVLTGTRRRDHFTPALASLLWLPVKYRTKFKILLFTYKVLNISKSCIVPMDHFALKTQSPLCFLESVKVGWEAEPSASRLLSCGTSSHSNTISTFKVKLKTFIFDNVYI